MMDISNEEVKKYIADYQLNLIAPNEINDFSKFKTEIGIILKFIQASTSGKTIKELLEHDYKELSKMSVTSVNLINSVTKAKIRIEKDEKGANMCKGIEEYAQMKADEAVAERCKGIEEYAQMKADEASMELLVQDNLEENIPEERIEEKLVKKFNLTEAQAKDKIAEYRK